MMGLDRRPMRLLGGVSGLKHGFDGARGVECHGRVPWFGRRGSTAYVEPRIEFVEPRIRSRITEKPTDCGDHRTMSGQS